MIHAPAEAERSIKSAVEENKRRKTDHGRKSIGNIIEIAVGMDLEKTIWGQKYAGGFRFGEGSRE